MKQLTPENRAEFLTALENMRLAKARENLKTFCQIVEVPGTPPPTWSDDDPNLDIKPNLKLARHHELVVDTIQKLADGNHEADGVMVFMPPGSAKSTYCSVIAPAWLAGRKPNYNVIAASYGDKLAVRFGRRVREIVKQEIYQKIMGTNLRADVQSASEWGLDCDSDYLAVGMGAAVTGFRADVLIIDDPVKNDEEANSEVIQEKTWDAFNADLTTRLKPGGKIFLIQTRWHEADLSGKILGEHWEGQSGLWEGTDGRTWEIINLPMKAEHPDDPLGRKEGEMLWSEWFRTKEVDRLERNAEKGDPRAIRTWASLYQQRPSPLEGTILKKSWWRKWEQFETNKDGQQILDKNHMPIPVPPVCEYVFASYDTAFSEDEYENNSYSAGTFWGIFETAHSNRFSVESSAYHAILLGAWRAHVDFRDLVDTVHEHYKQFLKPYGKQCKILVEKRASGTSLIQELRRARMPVKAIELEGPPGSRGKVPRAMQASYMLADGVIWYLPTLANAEVIKECSAFPNSTHTDYVDSVTHAINWLRKHKRLDMPWDTLSPQEQQDLEYEQYQQSRIKRNLYGSSATRRRPSSESPRLYGR